MISLKTAIFKDILIYVRTLQLLSVSCTSILVCSIHVDIHHADYMNKLSKMVNYCHFSVAENTISQCLNFVMLTYITCCYRLTPQNSGYKHLLFDSA